MVTIEIFRLDDWRERKSLIHDRLDRITMLWMALKLRDRGTHPKEIIDARKVIAGLTATTSRHANCLRSFYRLYERNRAEAEAVYEKATIYLQSYSSRKKPSSARATGVA